MYLMQIDSARPITACVGLGCFLPSVLRRAATVISGARLRTRCYLVRPCVEALRDVGPVVRSLMHNHEWFRKQVKSHVSRTISRGSWVGDVITAIVKKKLPNHHEGASSADQGARAVGRDTVAATLDQVQRCRRLVEGSMGSGRWPPA